MSVSKVTNQGGTLANQSSFNIDTSGLALGDLVVVYLATNLNNIQSTPASGFTGLLNTVDYKHQTWYKYIKAGGDITATNTFSTVNNCRAAYFMLAFRGIDENILSTYKGGIQANTHVAVVDWPALTSVRSAAVVFAFADTFDSSGLQAGTLTNVPSGYTDGGSGDFSYGLGAVHDARVFYALDQGGTVDPPDTAPSGATEYAYTAGVFAFRKYEGAQVA